MPRAKAPKPRRTIHTGPARSREVDTYLAGVEPAVRNALERLRITIRSTAPTAEEVMSYRIPTFKLHGPIAAYAAFPGHCGLYVMSPAVMNAFKDDVAPYLTGKVTLRFTPESPLPTALVKKLVKARMAENAERAGARDRAR